MCELHTIRTSFNQPVSSSEGLIFGMPSHMIGVPSELALGFIVGIVGLRISVLHSHN